MRALLASLAAIAIAMLGACAPADTGLAGCFDAMPDGRITYRPDAAPNSRGMCPTRREMLVNAAVDARFDAASCRIGCQLRGLDMLLNQPARPAITTPVKPPRLPPEPFKGR